MTPKLVNNPPSGVKTSLMTSDPVVLIRQNRQHTELLRKINFVLKLLVIATAPAVVYYGYYLYQHEYRTQMEGLDKLGRDRIGAKESAAAPVPAQPFDNNIINKRNIFTRYQVKNEVDGRVPTKDAHKFKSSIRVVGITFDQDYEVLIEDLDKKETVLLTKGKTINGATLVEISEKKLVFELDHNRIELEL